MELCSACGKSHCACSGELPASGLDLALPPRRDARDARLAPGPAPSPRDDAHDALPAPSPRRDARDALPAPSPRGDTYDALPAPDRSRRITLPPALVKLALVVLAGVGLWLGVGQLRRALEGAVDNAIVRPYEAPSRLVIASVTSDYSSSVLDDGAIVLRHAPAGSAAGLAAWYAGKGGPEIGATTFIDDAIATMKEHPTYRALETPSAPCRGDADPDTAKATRGVLSFGDDHDVTLWTCTLRKRGHGYLLAWAARSSDVDHDERGLTYMLKGSQLVRGDICSVNALNGGCHPSAANLIANLIASARR